MDYKYIEQLLDRYFQCQTTLQEESILRSFFAQSDVPAHLQCYQSMFQLQQADAEEHLGSDFDERVLSLINKQEAEHPVVKAKTVRLSYRFRPFYKAAAAVAIVLCFSMAVQQAMMRDQRAVPAASTLPAVVPGAPETACDKDGESTLPDSLAKLSDKADATSTGLQP